MGRFNHRVVRFNGATGAFMDVLVTNNFSQPFGPRFGPTNDLLVVSGNGNQVQRFNGQSGRSLAPLPPVA